MAEKLGAEQCTLRHYRITQNKTGHSTTIAVYDCTMRNGFNRCFLHDGKDLVDATIEIDAMFKRMPIRPPNCVSHPAGR